MLLTLLTVLKGIDQSEPCKNRLQRFTILQPILNFSVKNLYFNDHELHE